MRQPIHRRIPKAFAALIALGMLAGVLIWAKLRLAADIPRSALAEPDEAPVNDGVPDPDSVQDEANDDAQD